MQLRPYIGTAFLCAIVALLAAQVHSGFMLIVVAPFLLIWLLYSIYVVLKHPSRRRVQSIKVALWFIVVGGVLLSHWYYHRAARETANLAVDAILSYRANHGSFPETLDAAGVVSDNWKGWRVFYLLKDGSPSLFYPSTFVVFDTYWYDFERKSWIYQPD